MQGYIFDIKHFAVHDGPGIRTTVFLKGCGLKCIWCHNPESISPKKQLGFLEHKCVSCGSCVKVCPTGAQYLDAEGIHRYDRQKCTQCGLCVEACYASALTLYGKYMEAEAVVEDLLKDRDFYDCSGGGITLSGGECLLQPDFCAEILKAMQAEGIHTAVDTCGFVNKAAFDKVMPYTDLFLYDCKAMDPVVHKQCTGQTNEVILENLKYLDGCGKKIEIRIPYVPEFNADQITGIAGFLKELQNITGVRVLPYHNYAATKYKSLDMENTLPDRLPEDGEVEAARKVLEEFGLKVLR